MHFRRVEKITWQEWRIFLASLQLGDVYGLKLQDYKPLEKEELIRGIYELVKRGCMEVTKESLVPKGAFQKGKEILTVCEKIWCVEGKKENEKLQGVLYIGKEQVLWLECSNVCVNSYEMAVMGFEEWLEYLKEEGVVPSHTFYAAFDKGKWTKTEFPKEREDCFCLLERNVRTGEELQSFYIAEVESEQQFYHGIHGEWYVSAYEEAVFWETLLEERRADDKSRGKISWNGRSDGFFL